MLHRADCAKLLSLLAYVNPDYWPRPVHRPLWIDDPRRSGKTLYEVGFGMGVPPEVLLSGAGRSIWTSWEAHGAERMTEANAVLATVAPDVLHSMGLDPDRYVVVYE